MKKYIILPFEIIPIKNLKEREEFWSAPQNYLPYKVDVTDLPNVVDAYVPYEEADAQLTLEEFIETAGFNMGYPCKLCKERFNSLYNEGIYTIKNNPNNE